MASLLPEAIASLSVVKGGAARALNPAAAGRGIIVITTLAQENNPVVRAFTQRAERIERNYELASDAAIRAENDYPPAGVRYYLNGSLATRQRLRLIDNHSVTQVRTLHGLRAANFAHEADVDEVFLITTRP